MKKIYLLTMLGFLFLGLHAQVTTNSSSGLAATYADLASAITALNAATITSPVVITLTSGNPQVATAGGYSITQIGGTATNTITINGAGTGSTVTAAASPAVGSRTEAIFKIIGGDYITLQGFDLKENSINTVGGAVGSQQMTEFGIALFAASSTDGAQNNTIQNNTITLSSATTYQNAIGIFSTSASSSTNGAQAASSIAGTNSNNKFYSNTITGVAQGLYFISPAQTATVFESGNDVGGTSGSTGNTITFGISNTAGDLGFTSYSGATAAGIYFRNVVGNSARFNTINSTVTLTLPSGGIFSASGTAPTGITYTTTISNNLINLNNVGITAITGIDFGTGLNTGTIVGSNNTLILNQNATATTAGAVIGIKANYASATNTALNNIVTINQTFSPTAAATNSSAVTGITMSGASTTINANTNTITINQTNSPTAAITSTMSSVPSCLLASGAASTTNILGNNLAINRTTSMSVAATALMSGQSNGIQSTATTALTLGTSGNGNTITIKEVASGTGTSTFSGSIVYVFLGTQTTAIISYNNFNTTGGTIRSTGTCYGVYHDATISTNLTINQNTINIDRVASSGTIIGTFETAIPSTVAITITNNSITYTNLAGTTSAYGTYELGGASSSTPKNINSNIYNISGTNSGQTIAMINGYGTGTINSNNITINNTSTDADGIWANQTGSGAFTISLNSISLTSNSLSPTNMTGISGGATGPYQIFSNTFSALNLTGIITGSPIVSGITVGAGTGNNIYNNVVNNISAGAPTSTASPVVRGIGILGGTSTNAYKNKIYGISTASNGATTLISGITIAAGATNTVYNNLIGDLTAPVATNTDAIRGINITSTTTSTTNNIYYNTVYLSGGGGANFGSSGIFHTASATANTATLDLRNNIIVNNTTPNGTGLAVAYRRSMGSAGALANYASTSNNNLFFAGILGGSPSQLIYADGTSSAQTLANYKNGVFTAGTIAPRDAASITENPTFISTTGASPNYLHISTSVATQIDGAATPVSSVTDDYDSQSRNSSTPDIGADEFNFAVVAVGIEYLRGSKLGTANYLDWKVNCSSDPSVTLVLERSIDGRKFSAIQSQNVPAARCGQGFNYTDATPPAGINYYRLKTISPDGAIRYSVIVALINKDKGFELISVSPNPVKANAVLSVSTAKSGSLEISVTDLSGKLVQKQSAILIAGNNPLNMNFATLAAGTYNITVVNSDGERKTIRFVKY